MGKKGTATVIRDREREGWERVMMIMMTEHE